MKVKALSIYLNLDNEAFEENAGAELSRIFTDLAKISETKLAEAKKTGIVIFDSKGNHVGRMRIITDERGMRE